MMSEEIDELFGDEGGQSTPRTRPAIALAVAGVLLALLGMACTAAPGGVLTLLGLWWIERERERVDNGALPPDARPAVERARRVVFASLGVVIALFFLQALLFCSGFYQRLGDALFTAGTGVTGART